MIYYQRYNLNIIVDNTSRLIFEAYKGKYEPVELELLEFRRDITGHFINDFLKFKDVKTKKAYNVFQIFDKSEKNKPGRLHATSVFDCQLPTDEGMLFHSVDSQFMRSLPEYNLQLNSLPNKGKKITPDVEKVLLEIIDKVMDFDMKKRTVEAMGMKPETKEHFGDILGALNESAKNVQTEVVDFKREPSPNESMYWDIITVKLTRRNLLRSQPSDTYVKYYKIKQTFTMPSAPKGNSKEPMFIGLTFYKRVFKKDRQGVSHDVEWKVVPLKKYSKDFFDGYSFYDGMVNRKLDVDDDMYEALKVALMSTKDREKTLKTMGMKPDTKKHFGDIIGNL